jgi:uncharacterized protein YbaR (Trm112 family)/SAM-dependent methyltransferase
MKLSNDSQRILACPVCKECLVRQGDQLSCTAPGCQASFPIVDGVPVLINEKNSVFTIADFRVQRPTTFAPRSKLKQYLGRILPTVHHGPKTKANFERFASLLPAGRPKVLLVGAGEVGEGLDAILALPQIDFVETDVAFGPRTALICDGHDLPFADGSFDGAIIQATLEHVLDPYRCVDELHRVLKPEGVVYAETPFMQQVHMGRYDFTRFTYLGHRRLFRRFSETDSGCCAGPGTVLHWSLRYFMLSFVTSNAAVSFVKALSRCTLFWLKYLDYLVLDRPGTVDGASGFYFLGRKSDSVLPDRQLIGLYKGVL